MAALVEWLKIGLQFEFIARPEAEKIWRASQPTLPVRAAAASRPSVPQILPYKAMHPALTNGKQAWEIGKPHNWSYQKVGALLKELSITAGCPLPSKMADQLQGDVAPDTFGYQIIHQPKLGATAVLQYVEDGSAQWITYWSPEAVKKIDALIVAASTKKSPATKDHVVQKPKSA